MASIEMRFIPVTAVGMLDELLTRSQEEPILLFQHDAACSISALAYREMARLGGTVPLIDVQQAGEVKYAIEARTGVKHESPQVIVLRRGRAVWSASHYAITCVAVAAAMREHA